jgi:PKD repeat protein
MPNNIQINQGQSVIFQETVTGGIGPYSYEWTFVGGSITSATGPTASVFYNYLGSFDVTLKVTDSEGVSNTLTLSNLVTVVPV